MVSGSFPSASRFRGSSRLWQDRCPLPLTAEGYSRAWTATLTREGHAPSPLLTALSSGDSAQAPRPPGGRSPQRSSQRSWEDTGEAHSIQTKQLPKTPTNMHPRSTLPPACGEVAVTAVVPETMSLGVCPQGGSGSPPARGPASPCDPEQRGRLHLDTVGERTSFPQEVGATDLGRDPPAARWHVCPRWRRRRCGSRGQLPRPSCRACQALFPRLGSEARAGLQTPEAGTPEPVGTAARKDRAWPSTKCAGTSSVCPSARLGFHGKARCEPAPRSQRATQTEGVTPGDGGEQKWHPGFSGRGARVSGRPL